MLKRTLFGASIALTALLSACGGGGDSGGSSSELKTNTITIGKKTLLAGQSTEISAYAVMRGSAPNAMAWSAAPLFAASASDSSLLFSDANCTSASFVAPPIANASGEGSCRVVVTVPPTAKSGTWRITNVASSATAGSISSYTDLVVTGLSASGFRVAESSTPITGYVNKQLSMSVPFSVNPGTSVSDVKYSWSPAAENPSVIAIAGAKNSTATVIPLTQGQYRFDVQVTATVNGFPETASGSVVAAIYPASFTDVIDAGVPSVVVKGSRVSLVGSILNRDSTLSYATSWRQLDGVLGGPVAITLANSNSSAASFIAPTTLGTYGFEYKVVKTQADGTQAITTAQTSITVQDAPSGVFTVSAGDVQTIAAGSVAMLKATVGSQGSTSGVIYTYQWTQIGSTPASVALSNGSTATASFLPTVTGMYTFDLTVTATTAAGSTSVTGRTQVAVTAPGGGSTNFALSANGGAAQSVSTNTVVSLTGSQTTQGSSTGVVYAYAWAQNGATPAVATLSNASSPTATFLPTVAGLYGFRLTVTATLADGSTRTATSDTQVAVGGAASTFTVSAGDAKTVAVNASTTMAGVVSTQGSFSGTSFTYAWTQIGAAPAPVTLSNANSLTASFIPTVAGTYTFDLTVTAVSSSGTTTSMVGRTQVLATSSAGGGSFALSANAGPAQSIPSNSVASITGSQTTQGSSTGVSYAYAWTQIGATPAVATLSNANSSVATFIPTVSGVYSFRFTVTATLADATTRTASSETQVIVGGVGNTFTVSAGNAQVVTQNTAATMVGVVTQQGSFNGATFSYSWAQVGATPAVAVISNGNSLTASFVPTVVGTYTFELTVTSVEGGVITPHASQTQVLVRP